MPTRVTNSFYGLSIFDCPFGIFTLLTIALSVPWFAASGYTFGIFTLLTIVLSVL
jgi:hypothetical protein